MVDQNKLEAFVGQMLNDLGGAFSVPLVRIGGKFDLYGTLERGGPMTSDQLAQKTGLAERYLREWLSAQAASNYLAYDPATKTFSLPPEQAMVFANEESPAYMMGAFDCVASNIQNQDAIERAFKTGEGVQWGDQPGCLFCGVAEFFRPGYLENLVEAWLPALDGVVDKLKAGARVADVGCGHGLSTVMMAEAFPNSEFIGYDFHEGSIKEARVHAKGHGVQNARFEIALAKQFDGESSFDLVCSFDCLHDMGDPAGAAAHIRDSLKSDGTWMIVEPIAADELEDNLNPVGRLLYSASTMVCVPTSLAQEVGAALGAQAGEASLRTVIAEGGFTNIRRATETPFNMILEARV
ncbi:MAG: class I SAM-dependent methyltransferase [Anderseniella sp.]